MVPIRAAKARAELNREQVRGCPMKHPFVLLFAVASFVAVNTARADDNGITPLQRATPAPESPSTPTHPTGEDTKGNAIPVGGESSDITRTRTPEDAIREILRDKRPK